MIASPGSASSPIPAMATGRRTAFAQTAIGAIASGDVARGAGIGAVTGGAQSAHTADREKRTVLENCLRGRGYRVLN